MSKQHKGASEFFKGGQAAAVKTNPAGDPGRHLTLEEVAKLVAEGKITPLERIPRRQREREEWII